jgi:hypothetical protein
MPALALWARHTSAALWSLAALRTRNTSAPLWSLDALGARHTSAALRSLAALGARYASAALRSLDALETWQAISPIPSGNPHVPLSSCCASFATDSLRSGGSLGSWLSGWRSCRPGGPGDSWPCGSLWAGNRRRGPCGPCMSALALWSHYALLTLGTGIASVCGTPILAGGPRDRHALLTPLSSRSLAPHRALYPSLALHAALASIAGGALHAALALDALLASLASFTCWALRPARSWDGDRAACWSLAPQR